MNVTQEKITTSFTISHARMTIENLIENTESEMKKTDRRSPIQKKYYLKLQTILFDLQKSLKSVKESENLINNIDK